MEAEMESSRLVKVVWTECDHASADEPHVAHGVFLKESPEHFVFKVDGERLLYVKKSRVIKMLDEGGIRQ